MKNYKEIEGDLLDLFDQGQFDIIAHQCNCFHTMGGGIARLIKARYPAAFAADMSTEYGDVNKLGNFSTSHQKQGIIINIYSQYSTSTSRRETNYFALGTAFTKINELRIFKELRIGMPLIGCGLAGGDWNIVKDIIHETLIDMDVTIVRLPE